MELTATVEKIMILAKSPDASQGELDAAITRVMLDVFLGISPPVMAKIRVVLFQTVTFSNATAKTPQPLTGAIDVAFAEPMDIYESIVRLLALNFIQSFTVLFRRMTAGMADMDISQLNPDT